MLGTIVNTACIVAGTLIGTLFKKGLGEKYSKTLNYIPALLVPILWFLVKGLF